MQRYAIPAIAALAALCAGAPALAGSIQEPGETTGIALAPLPEGGYFVNFLNYGVHQSSPKLSTTVEIPVGLWSTPWTIAGGRVQLGVSVPAVNVDVQGVTGFGNMYYPEILYALGWNLTPNVTASLIGATYFPVKNDLTHALIGNRGTERLGGALTYSSNGWVLAAYSQYGFPYGSDATVPGGAHDWINLDLTALRVVGKWQFGIVAYGSADTTSAYTGYKKQSQTGIGPLVGYDFGPITIQAKLTTEMSQSGYGGRDTRFWTNVVIPLHF